MPTTTLRVPEELRKRIAKVAEKAGKTPHGGMLEGITQKVEEEELRALFQEKADARFTEMMKSGVGMPWHDMRAYLKDRASGKPSRAPKARKWRE